MSVIFASFCKTFSIAIIMSLVILRPLRLNLEISEISGYRICWVSWLYFIFYRICYCIFKFRYVILVWLQHPLVENRGYVVFEIFEKRSLNLKIVIYVEYHKDSDVWKSKDMFKMTKLKVISFVIILLVFFLIFFFDVLRNVQVKFSNVHSMRKIISYLCHPYKCKS